MNISEIKNMVEEAMSEFVMEDAIVECLKEKFNLVKGDSGFYFPTQTRDITFHNSEGDAMVEITYRII